MKLNELFGIEIDHITQDLSHMRIPYMYNGKKIDYIYPPSGDWPLFESPLHIFWKHDGKGGLKGRFSTPEYDYDVNFETFTYTFEGLSGIYDGVNVSFEVIKDGIATTDLTPTKYSNQVMGTIQNSLTEKLIQFDIDIVLFIAIDNIEARMRVYGRMADKFAKQFGKVYRNIRIKDGEAIAILANRIPEREQKYIQELVMKQSDRKPNQRDLEPCRR